MQSQGDNPWHPKPNSQLPNVKRETVGWNGVTPGEVPPKVEVKHTESCGILYHLLGGPYKDSKSMPQCSSAWHHVMNVPKVTPNHGLGVGNCTSNKKQQHQEQQQQSEMVWDLGTDVWLDVAHLSLKYGNKQRTLNHRMLWWTKRGNILSIQSLNSEFVDQRVRVHSVQMFYSERFLSTSF